MPAKKQQRRTVRPIKPELNEMSIAERAYARWIARGCPTSDGLEDWFAAQTELEKERTRNARA